MFGQIKAKIDGIILLGSKHAEVAEWSIASDCKSDGRKAYLGSNPGLSTNGYLQFSISPSRK